MLIKKFEDLPVWQDARILAKNIYSLTSKEKFKKDFGLKEQIQRASASILSNIAEGFERQSNKEFVNFLNYAKGSAGELRAQLYLTYDIGYITEREFNETVRQILLISQQISNFVKYLKKHLK
ncbi:MAG: four helix bundle protein [Elusimicrobiota bacterium]